MKFRTIAMLLLLPFLGGILIAGWAIKQYDLFGGGTPVAAPASKPADASLTDNAMVAPTQTDPNAAMAPGNSARTEGMLIANAARRAIDAGQPLGYVADQLRLRFGGSQPQHVEALINASARPNTLASLQAGLNSIGDSLLSRSDASGLLSRIQREANELFVLRKEGTVSAAPSQRLSRAKQYAANGQITEALSEVQKMPGAMNGKDWLAKAATYVAAHKALDALERAAATAPEAVPPTLPLLPPPSQEPAAQPASETPVQQAPAQ
jgi:hypothetical protein